MSKILLIDETPTAGINTREILALSNYAVLPAPSAADAAVLARTEHPDLVICDCSQPYSDIAAVTGIISPISG